MATVVEAAVSCWCNRGAVRSDPVANYCGQQLWLVARYY